MSKIGMLYPKGRLLKNQLYPLYANEASALGIELIFFSMEAVNWSTKTIEGYIFEGGRWHKAHSALPNLLMELEEKFIKEGDPRWADSVVFPPIQGHLGKDRWDIFEMLQNGEFRQELIPSEKIKSSGHFFRILKEYRKVLIKSAANSIHYAVEQKGNRFFVTGDGNTFEKSKEELSRFIINLQKQEPHIIQPHLLYRSVDGEVFDFKVSLKKNKQSQWEIWTIVPRFYLRNQQYLDEHDNSVFLGHPFYNFSNLAQRNFQTFCFRFLRSLEETYRELGEISLYVKFDDLKQIWVDEIQWKTEVVELVRKHFKDVLLLFEKNGDA
ncbi:YheC/YheD family protein [Peribacillus kribbensis]|uniref:YheC/YheD family protein n=1 Tax=Peribacillus kribbensis TaxID=356658 RepID=UPI0003FB1023|nr:YheC/YheD family protein [Peribacillus kribbensis]